MKTFAIGFVFEEMLWFPKPAEDRAYYFLPLRTEVDRDSGGQQMIGIIVAGTPAYLMFTAVWRVNNEALAALRKTIAKRDQIDEPATIKLTFAPVQVAKCEPLLGNGLAVWWDRVSVLPFSKEIENAMRNCNYFILIGRPEASPSEWVRAELRCALEQCVIETRGEPHTRASVSMRLSGVERCPPSISFARNVSMKRAKHHSPMPLC